MSRKNRTLLIVAVLLGLIAVGSGYVILSREDEHPESLAIELTDLCCTGDLASAGRLLDEYPGLVNQGMGEIGITPLHFLVMQCPDRDAISFLLDRGADPHARDGRGRTAIDCVALPNDSDLVPLLEGARKSPD